MIHHFCILMNYKKQFNHSSTLIDPLLIFEDQIKFDIYERIITHQHISFILNFSKIWEDIKNKHKDISIYNSERHDGSKEAKELYFDNKQRWLSIQK